jgi:hypothetical protein
MKIISESFSRLSRSVVVNDKVRFYAGMTDHWGFAISYCRYDRSVTIEVVRWYAGFEVYREMDDEDLVD